MKQIRFPGEMLRTRREACGWSLLDVHNHIHVPVLYLHALEEGNLDALPIHTYAVGFLNSYCQFLEVDPEPFLDQFHACAHAHPTRFRRTRAHAAWSRPRWLGDLIAWAAVCAILLLSWLTYTVVVRPFAPDAPARVDAGTMEAPAPAHVDDDL